jgi:hypothetical protein
MRHKGMHLPVESPAWRTASNQAGERSGSGRKLERVSQRWQVQYYGAASGAVKGNTP